MNSEKPTRQQSPPDEIKKQFRHQYASTQGPASFFEVDDPENWSQVTASTRGWVGRSLDFHDLMGAGHEKPVSEALYANRGGSVRFGARLSNAPSTKDGCR